MPRVRDTQVATSARLLFRGRPVEAERVEVSKAAIDGKAQQVMVSVYIKAKIMGLTHGEGGLALEFQLGDQTFRMDDAVLFDLDHTQEGWTHLQLTGTLTTEASSTPL